MKTALTPPSNLIQEFVNNFSKTMGINPLHSSQQWRLEARNQRDFANDLISFLAEKKYIAPGQPTSDDLLKFRVAHEAAQQVAIENDLFNRKLVNNQYQKEETKKHQLELAHVEQEMAQKEQKDQQIELIIQEAAKERSKFMEDKLEKEALLAPKPTPTLPPMTAEEKNAFGFLNLNPETATYSQVKQRVQDIKQAHEQKTPFAWGDGEHRVPTQEDVTAAEHNFHIAADYLKNNFLDNDARLEGIAEDHAFSYLKLDPDKASYTDIIDSSKSLYSAYEEQAEFQFADGSYRVPSSEDLVECTKHAGVAVNHLMKTLEPGNPRLKGNGINKGETIEASEEEKSLATSEFKPRPNPNKLQKDLISSETRDSYLNTVFPDAVKGDALSTESLKNAPQATLDNLSFGR